MAKGRKCRGCGKFFTPTRKSQVFHDGDCREAYYGVHYFSKVSAKKICPRCGTEFETSKPLAQTYCLPECRDAPDSQLPFQLEADQRNQEFFNAHPERQRGYSRLSRGKAGNVLVESSKV